MLSMQSRSEGLIVIRWITAAFNCDPTERLHKYSLTDCRILNGLDDALDQTVDTALAVGKPFQIRSGSPRRTGDRFATVSARALKRL